MIFLYFVVLLIAFVGLFKCAGLFVEGSCKIAEIMKIPKMIVGIVLVSLATTAPEFGVSVISASLGELEFALGNAVGSVICDDGIALALAAVVAPTAILINCRILRFTGVFLLVLVTCKLGRLIRFIPYPVVGGFLAGTGWLLVKGSLGVMTDLPLSFSQLSILFQANII